MVPTGRGSRIEDYTREAMGWYRAMIGQPVPLFGSPFADADGNVWLPSYRPAYPEEGSPYTVISSGGEWLGWRRSRKAHGRVD